MKNIIELKDLLVKTEVRKRYITQTSQVLMEMVNDKELPETFNVNSLTEALGTINNILMQVHKDLSDVLIIHVESGALDYYTFKAVHKPFQSKVMEYQQMLSLISDNGFYYIVFHHKQGNLPRNIIAIMERREEAIDFYLKNCTQMLEALKNAAFNEEGVEFNPLPDKEAIEKRIK